MSNGAICSIDQCGRAGKLTRGMCAKHYRSWLVHTPPDERPTAPRFQRDFWASVNKSPGQGCWVFRGRTVTRGHRMWGRTLAHRYSWTLANGPIPVGMWVLHRCDNPPCVNPRHLYLGTILENTADAVARGRNHRPPRKAICPAGHPKGGDNLVVVVQDGREVHRCRTCDNKRAKERMRAKRRAGRE